MDSGLRRNGAYLFWGGYIQNASRPGFRRNNGFVCELNIQNPPDSAVAGVGDKIDIGLRCGDVAEVDEMR